MEEVRAGRIAFSKLDVLHRRNLERILPRFGIAGPAEDVKSYLNRAWHRLDAWPESPGGCIGSSDNSCWRRCRTATSRSWSISPAATDCPWDAILGAEIAGDYKPKPRVYLAAAEAFDLPPGACMMVAAHTNDLSHAAACGLRTAHVARPNEHGAGRGEKGPGKPTDLAVSGLPELADLLGG